jgi:hypothetical protein
MGVEVDCHGGDASGACPRNSPLERSPEGVGRIGLAAYCAAGP